MLALSRKYIHARTNQNRNCIVIFDILFCQMVFNWNSLSRLHFNLAEIVCGCLVNGTIHLKQSKDWCYDCLTEMDLFDMNENESWFRLFLSLSFEWAVHIFEWQCIRIQHAWNNWIGEWFPLRIKALTIYTYKVVSRHRLVVFKYTHSPSGPIDLCGGCINYSQLNGIELDAQFWRAKLSLINNFVQLNHYECAI